MQKIPLTVPFSQKDEFKARCRELKLPYWWDSEKKTWGIDAEKIPRELAEFAPKAAGGKIRQFVIDCDYSYYPFASKAGARWDTQRKVAIYKGENLPVELTGFEPKPFTHQARMQRELNGEEEPLLKPQKTITYHAHQTEAHKLITSAWENLPGFLLADSTGLGKTLSAWGAALALTEKARRPLKILIVGPLGALDTWRETILWTGNGGFNGKANEITLINFDRLKNLFEAGEKKAKTLKGVAKFSEAPSYDIFIIDECHYLKNPASARTKLARAIEKNCRFCLWVSATAGQNPLEISYLSRLLASLTGDKISDIEKGFEEWCQKQGIALSRGKFGKWNWEGTESDNRILHEILFHKKGAAIRRRCEDIAGWPELQRIPKPLTFSSQEMSAYQTEWSDFLKAVNEDRLSRLEGKKDTAKGIAALGRLRQKASLLRIEYTCDLAEELLEGGHQIAISVEYLKTLDELRTNLEKRGYKIGEFSGRNTSVREQERKRYQAGELDVMIFTTESSISLHKDRPGGKPRAQINHDLRWSGIEQEQVDGRSHRNGEHANVYWCFAKDTIEERVATILLSKLESMNTLRGDDTSFGAIYKTITLQR